MSAGEILSEDSGHSNNNSIQDDMIYERYDEDSYSSEDWRHVEEKEKLQKA